MRRFRGSGVEASMVGLAALMATCTMICSVQAAISREPLSHNQMYTLYHRADLSAQHTFK